MAAEVSFEIYSFKNGNWMLDSVHDDKNMAIHQGRLLITSPHHMAIRVVEERYDPDSDQSASKIIFKDQKGADETPVKRKPVAKKAVAKKAAPKKKKKKKKKNRSLVLLVLSLGGIGLGLLAILGVLIAKFE
ncbi:MAG: hypothetical protein ACTSV1_03595 [Alphaproteobacteria bacterium]